MNLVADLGNTRAKIAVFEERKLLKSFSFATRLAVADLQKILKEFPGIRHSIVSSVINHSKDISNFLSNHTHSIPFDVNTSLPVKNTYQSPETLGKDRLSGAIGAWSLHKGKPVLLVDMGTCIKTDFVNEKGEYLGGSISPGINMRFKALNQFTDKLPLLSPDKNYHNLTGKSTVESITTGAQMGAFFEIKGFIDAYLKQYPNLAVVLSGGDATIFELEPKNHIFACPEAVLIGLNEILLFNAHN